ncbi:MAG: hypothetical protein H6Q29_1350, partial [Bacteroidetes bacterium]|nr:hypothetical protein [Bacteroidota bacterium]
HNDHSGTDKGSFMKKLVLSVISGLLFLPQIASGQSGETLVNFKASAYEYSFVKSNDRNIGQFWKISTVNGVTGWTLASLAKSDGVAAFGTLNNTANPPCPLNEPTYVTTFWPSSRDLIVRRKISLPTGARNVVIQLALDNGAKVYFNGQQVPGAEYVTSNGCATLNDPALRFAIPDHMVRQGDNFLAIQGVWLSSKNFLDLKVTGDLTVQVTTTIEGLGTVTPASPTLLLPGQSYTATYRAGAGYRLAGITINGVAQTITPTPDRLSPTEYTLPAITVNTNTNIVATFVLKQYLITAAGTVNGTLTPASLLVNHGATSGAFTATASTGYHVATVTSDPPPATLFTSAQPTSSPATNNALVIPNVLNDMTIGATFEQNYYRLQYSAGANGTVAIVPPAPTPYSATDYYLIGTTLTLKAVASANHYFTGWTGVDAALQLTNPLPVTMDADKNITASFAPLPAPVTITVGNLDQPLPI